MKRFFQGLFLGVMICLLFTFSLSSLANQPIKLIVDDKEIQCDVPPQVINGRTLVPARFLAEALGANVSWDESTNAVVVKTNYYDIIKLQFTSGIIVTDQAGSSFTIKVNREQLPAHLRDFRRLTVCGIGGAHPCYISSAIDYLAKDGYKPEYIDSNGFREINSNRYNIVVLYDKDANLLGYYIFDRG